MTPKQHKYLIGNANLKIQVKGYLKVVDKESLYVVGSFSLSHHSQNWITANRGNRAKGVSEWPYINE